MSKAKNLASFLLIACTGMPWPGASQPTVFTALQNPVKIADRHYASGDYAQAIELYKGSVARDPRNAHLHLKLARSYFQLKDYEKSVAAYDAYSTLGNNLQREDLYHYAEAQSVLKNYLVALENYKQCLKHDPDNEMVSNKIWRLSNLQFLFEDSAHYVVKPLSDMNSRASELCAIPFRNGIVFASNRKDIRPLDQANGKMNTSFYQLYMTEWKNDTISKSRTPLGEPVKFARPLASRFNTGPAVFYNKGTQMVFVASSQNARPDGYRPLGLYFASMNGPAWKFDSAFPHNGDDYSICDVSINEEGTKMYFSSDMKGGAGGKDIYSSTLTNGNWSKPLNVGDPINTSRNEVFPYLHRNVTLYFSSDGHPGMGDLDLFKSTLKRDGFAEPNNLGHPINSSHDDFGLSFDSLATHGYFTSNRKSGGYDDDLFEFDMDLQAYPFDITGILSSKEHGWSSPLEIKPWPNVKLNLVDTWQDFSILETTSGPDGSFSFSIPYFSRYHILITDEGGVEHKASLDLEKTRTDGNAYKVVVVKDHFGQLKVGR